MRITDHRRTRKALIGGMFVTATVLTWLLVPPANYLPEGKQGWIFAFIMQPPGQSVTTARSEFADPVLEKIKPHLQLKMGLKVSDKYLLLRLQFVGKVRNKFSGDVLASQAKCQSYCQSHGA